MIDIKRHEFWKAFLKSTLKEIKNQFLIGPAPFQKASKKVYNIIEYEIIKNLEPILLPTVVSYIREHKKQKKQEISTYNKIFSGDFHKTLELLEKYHSPTLQNIYNRLRKFKYHLFTALSRVYIDWTKIVEHFQLRELNHLTNLKVASGDEHGFGFQTSIFLFGDKGFVYKPIDVMIDKIFQDAFKLCENFCGFTDFYPLKVLPMKKSKNLHYGYIEFYSYKGNVKSKTAAALLFRKFGHLLAFGKTFKISDGHMDNLIVSYPNVYWIDLETAFHTFSGKIDKNIHDLEVTGLISNAKKENTVLGLVTGLQGGIIPRLALTSPYPFNDGTDDIYIRYFKLIHSISKNNRVFLKGEAINANEFIASIQLGYKEMRETIENQKKSIINFVAETFQSCEVFSRHLFMATACYARYVGLLEHFISYKKNDILNRIRSERLKTILKDEKKIRDFIIENEFTDLVNGVIPYFYRSSWDKSIYHASGAFRTNFFKTNLIEDIIQHINNLNNHHIDRELDFISIALNSTAGIKNWDDFKSRFKFREFDFESKVPQKS